MFDINIFLLLRANFYYTMATRVMGLNLSLKKILLPTLDIWEFYFPMLGLCKARYDMLGF